MAIGRGGMTKELFGNRAKKMKTGGVVAPGDGAKKTTSQALHTAKTPALKEGGKVKNTRSPLTINKVAKKTVVASVMPSGAQQYVRGNTNQEKRKLISSHMIPGGKNPAAFYAINAAGNDQEAGVISKIVGPKASKTDRTVAMYNEMTSRNKDIANEYRPKSGASRSVAGKVIKKTK